MKSVTVSLSLSAPVQVPAVVADQGVLPQQYAVYPAGYGAAAGPQYVQYAPRNGCRSICSSDSN
ncbi:hypothetical protein DAPPUDRAFT_260489 [Daphnia pulex]|uniref:Uncharacterized protein n=1 Tax=Daphnia pulex TaxID=6669 RepID=E9HJB0_DAPPU|nr:hypothetical protein DAPPUDRAFT_260489 [Daphnia pulex]|eukprot:EFX68176.1 hypothetical protein DAPPUDRAFT_260489 [Daphnia pulex]